MNYQEAISYLDSFVNYEKNTNYSYNRDLSIKRVEKLYKYLGIDYSTLKVIHIAGTKGKGSTATFVAASLASLGYKVGLYTSPHILDLKERISLLNPNKQDIPSQAMTNIINKLKPKLKNYSDTPTFFEVLTAIALIYFIQARVDYLVLETGLGGRLDATNVVNPLVSIITHIGYDHTDKLGKTLKAIAYEKAGIIKPNSWVISASQNKTVERLLRQQAKEKNVAIFFYNQDFKTKNVRFNPITNFDFIFAKYKLAKISLKLKGSYQLENAALALAAVRLLQQEKIKKASFALKQAIAKVYLPARLEVISLEPLVVLDCAHNPSSFYALGQNLKLYFPKKDIILIFAAAKDKDVKSMLKFIDYTDLIFTQFSHPRSFSLKELIKTSKEEEVILAKNVVEAYNKALKLYGKNKLIVISGSFFLVSEAKKIWINLN